MIKLKLLKIVFIFLIQAPSRPILPVLMVHLYNMWLMFITLCSVDTIISLCLRTRRFNYDEDKNGLTESTRFLSFYINQYSSVMDWIYILKKRLPRRLSLRINSIIVLVYDHCRQAIIIYNMIINIVHIEMKR